MSRTALVAGATGLVGRCCLAELLGAPEYSQVVALVRRPLDIRHPKLEVDILDWDSLSPEHARADDVFCALGTTLRAAGSQEAFRKVDHDTVLRLAECSLTSGARRFALVSSIGAADSSRNFYLRTKGETERRVSELGFDAIHIFRPSFLVGERSQRRPGERLGIRLAHALEWTLVGPLRQYRPIGAEVVGRAMVSTVLLGQPGRHVYFYEDLIAAAGRQSQT